MRILSRNPDEISTSFLSDTITPSTSGSRSMSAMPGFGTQDEDAGRQAVCEHRTVGDDRHAARAARGLACGGIEDVMVAPAVLDEVPLVVARCAERPVREIELRETAIRCAARVLNAEPPGPSILQPGHVDIAAALNHEGTKPSTAKDVCGRDRPRSPCRCRRGVLTCLCARGRPCPRPHRSESRGSRSAAGGRRTSRMSGMRLS